MQRSISIVGLGTLVVLAIVLMVHFIPVKSVISQIFKQKTNNVNTTKVKEDVHIKIPSIPETTLARNSEVDECDTIELKSSNSERNSQYSPIVAKNNNGPATSILVKFKEAIVSNFIGKVVTVLVTIFRTIKSLFSFEKIETDVPPLTDRPSQQYHHTKHDKRVNDRISIDINTLSHEHQLRIYNVTNSTTFQSPALHKLGKETHFILNDHLVYRYFAAVDWASKYNGKFVQDAIEETAKFRKSFNIHQPDIKAIRPLLESGLAYVAPQVDKHGRTIIMVHVSKNVKVENDVFLKFMMYIIERAEKQSVNTGSGKFLTIIDFQGFSWNNCPPISVIKVVMEYLKWHYPHRGVGNYIINTSSTFQLVWNIFKPLIPKKVLAKTHVIGGKDSKKRLDHDLGLDYLDELVGGRAKGSSTILQDIDAYIANGYWK